MTFQDEYENLRTLKTKTQKVGDKTIMCKVCESDMPIVTLSSDVFLLCFSISSLSSLISATTTLMATLSMQFKDTPVILVGCQADKRNASPDKKYSVSRERALAYSQQCGAVMYVETSAVLSHTSCAAPFEVAALTYLGQISTEPFSETNTSNEVLESAKHVSKRHSFNKQLVGCTLN